MNERTHPDGSIETYDRKGRLVRVEWSERRSRDFTRRAHPDKRLQQKAYRTYVQRYGYAPLDRGPSGKEMPVEWKVEKDGRFLKMRTYQNRWFLPVSFANSAAAAAVAAQVGGNVYGSSYPQTGENRGLDGSKIPIQELVFA